MQMLDSKIAPFLMFLCAYRKLILFRRDVKTNNVFFAVCSRWSVQKIAYNCVQLNAVKGLIREKKPRG